jgi:hypothetical protein
MSMTLKQDANLISIWNVILKLSHNFVTAWVHRLFRSAHIISYRGKTCHEADKKVVPLVVSLELDKTEQKSHSWCTYNKDREIHL